jgi:hypothetical protein
MSPVKPTANSPPAGSVFSSVTASSKAESLQINKLSVREDKGSEPATKYCFRQLPSSLHPGEVGLVGQLQDQSFISGVGRLAMASQEAKVSVRNRVFLGNKTVNLGENAR